jgi:transposase
MRYELSDYEWTAIRPMLPNKPRGVRRVNDRRVLNGIFWVLRSGALWRDLPAIYGPRTTCYNRFVRWRQAGVWDQIMDALAAGHDAAVQMIDTSVVRVHQHGACMADNHHQDMGRSRGGLTSKIHAVVDTNGLPVHLALTPGEAHDNRLCSVLLSALLPQTMLLADRGYDADWIRELARQQEAWANIPPKRNRKDPICFRPGPRAQLRTRRGRHKPQNISNIRAARELRFERQSDILLRQRRLCRRRSLEIIEFVEVDAPCEVVVVREDMQQPGQLPGQPLGVPDPA